MSPRVCVFDAYGTLFDVTAAARRLAEGGRHPVLADRWQRVAAHWRDKQLSYSWLRQITGDYASFWQVTQDALDWALAAEGLEDSAIRQDLLDLYRELDCYPEVPGVLGELRDAGIPAAILSNGSPDMLQASVAAAGIDHLLDDVLSVDAIGVFKPDARVYAMVGERFGTDLGETLFVSSNGWDVAGAARYGFSTVWANRRGEPVDRLPARPDHQMPDLSGLPAHAESI